MDPESLARAIAARLPDLGLTVSGRRVGQSDRWLFVAEAGAVSLRLPDGGPWLRLEVTSPADLDRWWPDLERSARAWAPRLTVYRLVAGTRYRILRDLVDHRGQRFAAGTELTFVGMDFLPYDDGYTVRFAEGTMAFTGDSELYEDFGLYVGSS